MDYVSLKIENHIGLVTLNNPPVNILNRQVYREIIDTFQSINKNHDIWITILKSEGKHFSAGNDVNEFFKIANDEGGVVAHDHAVSGCMNSVYECQVPVIGAVQGMAIGGGMILASCCDMLVASENAKFYIAEAKLGIVGGACFISRMLPQQLHRYMSYSGDLITAEQLKQYGAVMEVVPEDKLVASALRMAEHLLNNPPQVLRGFKAAMNKNENAQLYEKHALEIRLTMELMLGKEDIREALSAFLEKRKPVYKGS